jgi:hypothetical protein
MVIDFNASTITVNNSNGLVVTSNDGIVVDGGSIRFKDSLGYGSALSASITDSTHTIYFEPLSSVTTNRFNIWAYDECWINAQQMAIGNTWSADAGATLLVDDSANTYAIKALGSISAATYYGDGSNLTGISGTTYSAGDGLDLTGTTFSLDTSLAVYTLTVGGAIFHDGDTDTRQYFSTDEITFYAGGVAMLTLSESTVDKAIFECHVEPTIDSSFNLGYTTKAWKNIYGDAIYRNGSALDVYDDLYELSQVKSKKEKNEFGEKIEVEKLNAKGLPVIDPLSIPQELTNYDDVVATLKHDNCDLITQADIDEYILDDEEAGWMLKTDFTLLSDLTMGAVRQLDSEVISMFELLSSRITALENGTKAKGA